MTANNEKWTWHTEGPRAFVLTADGFIVCEILAPANNNRHEIAQRIVSDHNQVLDKLTDAPTCGRGHKSLPLVLWDCPVCHENTKHRAEAAEARLKKAVEQFLVSGCSASEVAAFLHVPEDDARAMLKDAEARLVMRE